MDTPPGCLPWCSESREAAVAAVFGQRDRRAASVLTALDRLTTSLLPQASYPLVAGYLLLARAEQSRLERRSDPERWRAAATAWERLEYPFDAAYARFREAEALLAGGASRPRADQVLRGAHQTSVMLEAGPLRREVELLAQRGRLARAYPREAEVLALGRRGRTNRQIGQALFITPRPPVPRPVR